MVRVVPGLHVDHMHILELSVQRVCPRRNSSIDVDIKQESAGCVLQRRKNAEEEVAEGCGGGCGCKRAWRRKGQKGAGKYVDAKIENKRTELRIRN